MKAVRLIYSDWRTSRREMATSVDKGDVYNATVSVLKREKDCH